MILCILFYSLKQKHAGVYYGLIIAVHTGYFGIHAFCDINRGIS